MATTFNSEVQRLHDEIVGVVTGCRQQVDRLKAEFERPHPGMPGRKDITMSYPDYQTPGARFTEKADIDLLKKTNRLRFQLDGGFWPKFESKTLIDSSALGFSTPGILSAERITGIVPLPRRRLTVRDLLRTKPITAGAVDWISELAFTNAASPQTEGSPKAESANTFAIKSEKTRTLAHWIPLSKQCVDDLPELRRFIDENLLYGLKLIEEWEILFGDGSGDHLHGLVHQAAAYAGTYSAAGDTKLDVLRHAILELEASDRQCSGFILNPKDAHDVDLIKTEEGGINKGSYLVGDPLGGNIQVKTLWNRAVVTTTAIPSGKFLAGNFANAIIGDRQGAVIDLSENYEDYFTRNLLCVRAEERICLAVLDSGTGWRYGSL